jgi:hypothetical protein
MPYNLLLLPLIGGFLFVHLTHFFRFGAQRLDGYRLLFQSAIAGICLSAAARLIDLLIDLTPLGVPAHRLWIWFSAVQLFRGQRSGSTVGAGFRPVGESVYKQRARQGY